MTIFNFLPTVNKCCFCIDLKWGSVIIAICAALNLFFAGIGLHNECIHEIDALDILRYIVYVAQFLVVVAAIVFLVGIFMDKAITATIFLYATLFSVVMALITFIVIIITSATKETCSWFRYDAIIQAVICVLIWFYFLSVVKSYREQMVE